MTQPSERESFACFGIAILISEGGGERGGRSSRGLVVVPLHLIFLFFLFFPLPLLAARAISIRHIYPTQSATSAGPFGADPDGIPAAVKLLRHRR